jgi:hypothetical protein
VESSLGEFGVCDIFFLLILNEPVERVTFLKTASPAESKIGNYFLALKLCGSGNRASFNFKKALMIVET